MTIFVPNYKLSCRIKQGFNDGNFVKIGDNEQLALPCYAWSVTNRRHIHSQVTKY